MLMPKRVKYRKTHRGRMNGKAYRGSSIAFGEFGLQALQPAVDADADRLVRLLEGLPTRVNLIPWNPWPGTSLRSPPLERVVAFHERVVRQGQLCLVRWPRGREIAAACGQLVRARGGAGFEPALAARG